ncbi:MAG: SpoIIE family protein phosphatase [Leptospiraceae bacterium]|nr:SpoIIE family protein phosphatase [Leptospiraceae bacterium]
MVKLFKKIFKIIAKYTSYIFSVSIFSAGIAGIISSVFALYYFDAVRVEISQNLMLLLKVAISIYWILIMAQMGIFHKLGFSGVGKTVTTINKTVIATNKDIFIPDDLKQSEYKNLLSSLLFYPVFNSINLVVWITILIFLFLGLSIYLEGFKMDLIFSLLTMSCIILFICSSFTYILTEALTGPLREKCKRIMTEKGIYFKERAISTVRIKLVLFLLLFVVNLFLSNTLTYYNKNDMSKVIYFSIIAVLVSMLIAHTIFTLIYNSLKQIEYAAYDLQRGGTGLIFPGTLDKEFINVSLGINSAAKKIKDYQERLEEKVKKRTHELNSAIEQLKKKDEILETELMFAADIQKGIIPEAITPWNGIKFTGYYSPMGKVSGDYYDVFYFPSHIFVLMADVSGHGVPAALITMAAKQAFTSIIEENLSPAEIYRKVNTILVEQIKTSDYLTAFLLKIDHRNRVTYGNAAHPKAIHYIASKNEFKLLDSEGMFIGSFIEANESYENIATKLSGGDRIFLYTDGVPEHKNLKGEEFGMDRFLGLLKENKEKSLTEQVEIVIKELHSFIGKAPIRDDISIISLELESIWGKFIEVYNNGIKFLKIQNLENALEKLLEAYKMVPSFPNIHFHLSLTFFHLGDLEKAEFHIMEFIKNKPEDIQGLKLGVNIFSKLGKDKEKIDFMNTLNEIDKL